jgi:hypothetical protein
VGTIELYYNKETGEHYHTFHVNPDVAGIRWGFGKYFAQELADELKRADALL